MNKGTNYLSNHFNETGGHCEECHTVMDDKGKELLHNELKFNYKVSNGDIVVLNGWHIGSEDFDFSISKDGLEACKNYVECFHPGLIDQIKREILNEEIYISALRVETINKSVGPYAESEIAEMIGDLRIDETGLKYSFSNTSIPDEQVIGVEIEGKYFISLEDSPDLLNAISEAVKKKDSLTQNDVNQVVNNVKEKCKEMRNEAYGFNRNLVSIEKEPTSVKKTKSFNPEISR